MPPSTKLNNLLLQLEEMECLRAGIFKVESAFGQWDRVSDLSDANGSITAKSSQAQLMEF